MNKDAQFDAWLKLKKNLHNSTTILSYQEGQVWWAAIGCNIGFEQDGKSGMFSRPVAIVRGFSRNIIWIVPLSTTGKRGTYYQPVKLKGMPPGVALLSQLKVMDTARLLTEIGIMKKEDLAVIKRKLRALLS